MVDIVKEAMNLLLDDTDFMALLGNNRKAVCRILLPDANMKPRVLFNLIDDEDGDFYDGISTTYSADIQVAIQKGDSFLFDTGNKLNEIFTEHGFERLGNVERYNYNVDLYEKIMSYRCKIKINGSDFEWLK